MPTNRELAEENTRLRAAIASGAERIVQVPELPTYPEDRIARSPEGGKTRDDVGLAWEYISKKDGSTHVVHDYDRECLTCHAPNSHFRDETSCRGCGGSLGSLETARRLSSCPTCHQNAGAKVKGKYYRCANGDCKTPIATTFEEAKRVPACPNCSGTKFWEDWGDG